MVGVIRFYRPKNIKLVKALNQYVWDSYGRKYLDTHNGNGAGFLGHHNKYVVKSIRDQLEKIYVASIMFDTDILEEAITSLGSILPKYVSHVYFLNSGSEAVELGLKVARFLTKRSKILYFTGSFHGRTLGALSVTWNRKYRYGIDGLDLRTIHLPYNNAEYIEKIDHRDLAGVIVELIQGEGGLNVASSEFISAIEELRDRTGSILIIDEIQTGFGRTGYRWLHEKYNITPDVLLVGKSIGGGFPVSIVALNNGLDKELPAGFHGSTFGGNPIALAAIKGSIKAFIKDNVVDRARSMGTVLNRRLYDDLVEKGIVKRVKGMGLMLGIEVGRRVEEVIDCLQRSGVLALRSGETIVRFLPPYMISSEDIDHLVASVERCVSRPA